jgi:hypothetical protein
MHGEPFWRWPVASTFGSSDELAANEVPTTVAPNAVPVAMALTLVQVEPSKSLHGASPALGDATKLSGGAFVAISALAFRGGGTTGDSMAVGGALVHLELPRRRLLGPHGRRRLLRGVPGGEEPCIPAYDPDDGAVRARQALPMLQRRTSREPGRAGRPSRAG